ncbi:MAG: hypothetical protein ACLU8F_03335 [Clostridia bacterium]
MNFVEDDAHSAIDSRNWGDYFNSTVLLAGQVLHYTYNPKLDVYSLCY